MFLLAIVRSRLGVGLVLGVVQLIVAGVLLTIHEHREGDSTTTLGVALAVWGGLAPFVIVTTAVTVTIVEGGAMFTREWGKKHREAGKRESTEGWRADIAKADLSPEQEAKLKELRAKREEREKEPA